MDNGHTYKLQDGQLVRGSNSLFHRFARFRQDAGRKQAKNAAVLDHVMNQLKAKYGDKIMSQMAPLNGGTLEQRINQLRGAHIMKGDQLKQLSMFAMQRAGEIKDNALIGMRGAIENALHAEGTPAQRLQAVMTVIKNRVPDGVSKDMAAAIISEAARGLNAADKTAFANLMASPALADAENALKFAQSDNMTRVRNTLNHVQPGAGFLVGNNASPEEREMVGEMATLGLKLSLIVPAARDAARTLGVQGLNMPPATNATLFSGSAAMNTFLANMGMPDFPQYLRDSLPGYIQHKNAALFARQGTFMDVMLREFGQMVMGNALPPLRDALVACLNQNPALLANLHTPVTETQLAQAPALREILGAVVKNAITNSPQLKQGMQIICDFFRETVKPMVYERYHAVPIPPNEDPFITYMKASLSKVLGSGISSFMLSDPTLDGFQSSLLNGALFTEQSFHNNTINEVAQNSMGACLRANILNFDQIFTPPLLQNNNQIPNPNVNNPNPNLNVNNLNPNNQPNIGNNPGNV
jgi:hypothetical protein